MSDTVIRVENLSRQYRLGVISGGQLRDDLSRWWARRRGKPDPLLKIGQQDHGNIQGETLWALRDVSFGETGRGVAAVAPEARACLPRISFNVVYSTAYWTSSG